VPLNAAELLVMLERSPSGPLRVRLAAALRDAIRAGQLVPGTTLPSTRVIAQDLGVSRGVAVDAYAQLAAEGFITTRPGTGTTVAFLPAAARPDFWTIGETVTAPVPDLDLRPGWPDLAAFPRREWAAAVRDVLGELATSALGYAEPWGSWELRRQLAVYLTRVRGAIAAPAGVVVVNGVTQGLTLLCRLLREQGQDRLAVEDPSNAFQRELLARLGMDVVNIPVDDQGLRVDALAGSGAGVVLCTPAHQYPSGVVLSPTRRASLLRWAADADALVLEDDYDAEFRYERGPMGCLQGMDPLHVALLGSVSKTLAPALRIGWVLCPPQLLTGLRTAKRDDDFGSNAIDQHVLARLLELGTYDRHLLDASPQVPPAARRPRRGIRQGPAGLGSPGQRRRPAPDRPAAGRGARGAPARCGRGSRAVGVRAGRHDRRRESAGRHRCFLRPDDPGHGGRSRKPARPGRASAGSNHPRNGSDRPRQQRPVVNHPREPGAVGGERGRRGTRRR